MNLIGYYKAEDVWIPDPISEQNQYANAIN